MHLTYELAHTYSLFFKDLNTGLIYFFASPTPGKPVEQMLQFLVEI